MSPRPHDRTLPRSAPGHRRPGIAADDVARTLKCLAIVPVYNERDSIGKLVRHLRRALPHFDIVIIDDGSTDDTARQVPPGTPVVSLPFNLGIGGAMQTGYRYAALNGYDVAVQVDGDGQHRPSEVIKIVEHMVDNDIDLVIGSRFLENVRYRQTVVRAFGSWLLRSFIRALSGHDITDCTSGFRACNKRVIHAYAHWYPEDYPEPEVILLLSRIGFKIAEVPVKMRQRKTGQSSIGLLSGAFYMAKVTTCLLLDLVRQPWPAGKVFSHAPETHPAGDRREPAPAGRPAAQSVQA
jgi:glycosyltransferase involved in cell wall biosynthesis